MIKVKTLREKQTAFTGLVAELITEAYRQGFTVTLGEAYRSPEEATRLAKARKGIKASLHTQRLALDLNLFKNGLYLTNTPSYESLGIWWEARHPLCRWGGRFKRADGNHFSFSYNGRA